MADAWLLLSFVGTRFCGWQSQGAAKGGKAAVEDALAAAFDAVLPSRPRCAFTAASRTDAAVHARELLLRTPLDEAAAAAVAGDAAALQLQLNACLPADVRVQRLRLCRPSQIQMRGLAGLRKQYSYYLRTGNFREAAPVLQAATHFEGARLDVSRMAAALQACADGRPHCFAPFAAAKRGSAGGGKQKSDRESVRLVEVAAISLLRPSQCGFHALDSPLGFCCAADDAGEPVLAAACSDLRVGLTVILNARPGSRPMRKRQRGGATGGGEGGEVAAEGDCVEGEVRGGEESAASLPDEPCVLRIRFVGKGFLRHMLRRLVGAAVAVGKGALPVSYIRDALAASDARLAAGASDAPAAVASSDGAAHDYVVANGRGLWLEKSIVPQGFWEPDFSTPFRNHGIAAIDRHLEGVDDE